MVIRSPEIIPFFPPEDEKHERLKLRSRKWKTKNNPLLICKKNEKKTSFYTIDILVLQDHN